MPVTLDMKWWKKAKPLTLMGETVTEAMKKVDAATVELFKKPTRENIARLSGALKLLQTAFTQTKAKCNKTVHGECIKALTEAEAKAQKAYNAVQTFQVKFATDLQTYQTYRNKTAEALTTISTTKDLAKVAIAIKAIELFLTYLNEGLKNGNLSSDEMTAGMKYMTASQVLLRDIEKHKVPPADASAKVQWQKQIDAMFRELGETAKKVGALGGYTVMPVAAQSYKLVM